MLAGGLLGEGLREEQIQLDDVESWVRTYVLPSVTREGQRTHWVS